MIRGLAAFAFLAALVGCDRNMEPYVPGEEPREPDLSRIFPEGANPVERLDASVELPPAPGTAPAPGSTRQGPDPTAGAAPIRGVITLAPELLGRAPRGGIVFLIARLGGAGPPVAVRRMADPSFPLEWSLGPEHRMIRGIPFAGELEISARLDLDGEATSRGPGDLEGHAEGGHAPGSTGVAIVLRPLAEGTATAPRARIPEETLQGLDAARAIRGVVRVSPELAGDLPEGGSLFIIARTGPGPPLAVRRVPAPSFPHEFRIGPEDRMIQSVPFAGEIQLSARIDQDGNAISRTPGDLQGSAPGTHAPGAAGIEIVLDEAL